MTKTKKEEEPKIKIYESSTDNPNMARVTFNDNSGNGFFKRGHKSQKEFSDAKSGLHETFSFGSSSLTRSQYYFKEKRTKQSGRP